MSTQIIVVAQSGWVFVGERHDNPPTGVLCLERASVIRRWGTENGLGQLCLTGATKETILDAVGRVDVPTASIVAILHVGEGVRLGLL